MKKPSAEKSLAPLRASFVRVRGEHDRIYVHRSNGTEVSWVFPTYGDMVPHDLVHLVVESAFGLKNGFWGRVDAGVDPGRIAEEANRMGGPDKYRAFGEDRRELLLAEGLAGAFSQGLASELYSMPEVSDESVKASIRENCAKLGVEIEERVTIARIRRAREALLGLVERWRGIGEKGTITLRFWPRDPEGGFGAMVEDA